jgi:hypothetical protein
LLLLLLSVVVAALSWCLLVVRWWKTHATKILPLGMAL